jgi:hypothetical protein
VSGAFAKELAWGWGLGKFVLDVDFVSILSDFQHGTDKGRICDRRFSRARDRWRHCGAIVGVGLETLTLGVYQEKMVVREES